MYKELKGMLIAAGASLVGFADLTGLKPEGYVSGVSIGLALNPRILNGIIDNPTKDYEGEYDRANDKLNELALMGAKFLTGAGRKAKAIIATALDYDPVSLSVPYQQKTTAILAGLGWIGKLDVLVTEQFGSGLRFGTILTDIPPSEGERRPVMESKCGACEACADKCPAAASKRVEWKFGMKREDIVDIQACNKSMTERVEQLGLTQVICGLCLVSCPWTRRYINAHIDS